MRTFRRRSTTTRKAIADPIVEPMTGTIAIGVSGSAITGAQPIVPDPAAEAADKVQGLSTGFDF